VGTENGIVRWLALDGAANARVVVPGVLLRSDNLQALTSGDVRLLVEYEALEVVLDLRTDVEVAREGPGPMMSEARVRVEHRSLYPQAGAMTDLDAITVKPWGETDPDESPGEQATVRTYMNYLSSRPDSIVASVATIASASGAALVHCAAGKDRTGVVVALALDAAGVDRRAIVLDYLASAERIEAIIARLLSSPTYRAELEGHDPMQHAPAPGTIERMLELVDQRFGGSAEWLCARGLNKRDLERLRHRLARPGGSEGAKPSLDSSRRTTEPFGRGS
jgi:protein-tyrosine phosphatase